VCLLYDFFADPFLRLPNDNLLLLPTAFAIIGLSF
jgi:hypothetical protein